jgi:hypothetical protein
MDMVDMTQAVKEVPVGDMIPGDMMEVAPEVTAQTIRMEDVVVLIIPMEVAPEVMAQTIRMGDAVTVTIQMGDAVILTTLIRTIRMEDVQILTIRMVAAPTLIIPIPTIRTVVAVDPEAPEEVQVTMDQVETQVWEMH